MRLARALSVVVACAVALVAPAIASAAPNAAVGGIRDPASGVLELTVQAVSDAGLVSASASLGSSSPEVASFEDGACRSGSGVPCPAVVTLRVSTFGQPKGVHDLTVTVLDEAGGTFATSQAIFVDNTPPENTPSVTVTVGSGIFNPVPSPPGGGGTTPPAGGPVCRSPRLSMFLDQRPLRVRRGVPVLAAGRTYRFAGRLTCLAGNKRRPAPRGTIVQIRNRLRGRTFTKPAVKVGRNGRIVARLAYRSSRVIIFRAVGSGGKVAQVRIGVRVVKRRR